MSLLMKALEKAAQDRKDTDATTAPSGSRTSGINADQPELTLEPALSSQHKPVAPPTSATTREAQQAATVIRAARRDRGGIGALVRDRPVLVIGTLAVLIALGYGGYVYLQISNPGLFTKQPQQLARPLATSSVAMLPTAPPPAASNGSATTGQMSLVPMPLLPRENVAPTPLTANGGDTPAASATAQTSAPEAPPIPLAPRDTIKVTVGSTAPTLNPLAMAAYQAFESGNFDTARQQYEQLLVSDRTNLDALLGLAAIATKHGDSATATKYYMQVLELEPHNAAAQAGLLGMFGGTDPVAAETRLKQLIAHEPSPFLYFTLGNIYADQQHWPDAQEAYFQASHLQPDNPDYAYNLAVGLDHIGQPKLALEFYRRALQLAGTKGRSNFSTAAAEERANKLQKAVE